MKRILSFILSINLIFILVPGTVLAAPSWPSAVSIEADGGILMEAQTGTVLFAKNEDQPYYPASITKILTALIVLEHCSLDEEVTFSHDDVYNVLQNSIQLVRCRKSGYKQKAKAIDHILHRKSSHRNDHVLYGKRSPQLQKPQTHRRLPVKILLFQSDIPDFP